jgi:DNA-directed RNA polymerase subunit omega
MSKVNDGKEEEDQIISRYSIVIATAKRARQLVDGDDTLIEKRLARSVSTAVMELYEGKIDIV